MNTPPRFLLAFAVILLAVPVEGFCAKPRIEEEVVGPRWVQGSVFTLSEKSMRLAATYAKGDKWVVSIDGVESEPYDDIVMAVSKVEPEFNEAGTIVSQSDVRPGPVAFSRDGKRHAFAGRRGEDVIVMLDGKEIFRGKFSQAAPPVSLMQFSPDGKHLFFYQRTGDTMQSFRLMMDGQPVTAAFDRTPPLFFSNDGTRWLINASKAKQPLEKFLVIDGKEAVYSAERAAFSPDSKHVVCTSGGRGEQKLLVDGKPLLSTIAYVERFRISATGEVAAIVQQSNVDQKQLLYLNGKLLPGVEGVRDVVYSPDGKHWAAKVAREMFTIWWVILDGKKHQEYKTVGAVTFTPDSSKAVYIAENSSKRFVVVNGEEDAGNTVLNGIAMGKTGNKLAYVAGPNYVNVYYEGKVSPQYRLISSLFLSPDGNRLAYFAQEGIYSDFILDGEKQGTAGEFGGKVVFSPDSKHIMAAARAKEGDTIYLDGTFLPARRSIGTPREFTPDSQHVIVAGNEKMPDGRYVTTYWLDGELVARFSTRGVTWANSPTRLRQVVGVLPFGVSSAKIDVEAKDWEYQPDGSIVLLGSDPGPEGYGPMRRIKVTPAPGTTFATWIAEVNAAEEKVVADAAAAKEKAAADKAAAVAKSKADYEAKAAANAKARQDALEAKKKAAVDAAAAKKAKPPR